jgi:hypothetical protein
MKTRAQRSKIKNGSTERLALGDHKKKKKDILADKAKKKAAMKAGTNSGTAIGNKKVKKDISAYSTTPKETKEAKNRTSRSRGKS